MKKVMRIFLKDKKGKEIELKPQEELVEFAEKTGINSKLLIFDIGRIFGQIHPESAKLLDTLLMEHIYLGLYLGKKYNVEIKMITEEKAKTLTKDNTTKSYIG